jgi:hypothetical protein
MMSTVSTTFVVDLDYPVSGTTGMSITGIIDLDYLGSWCRGSTDGFDGWNENFMFGLYGA